jgi:hypothetical protein
MGGRARLAVLVGLAAVAGCGDPPTDGSLRIDIANTAVREGFTALEFNVVAVQIFYGTAPPAAPVSGTCDAPGATVITVNPPLPVHVNLSEVNSALAGAFFAPPGHVTEIRLVVDDAHGTVLDLSRRAHLDTRCGGGDTNGLFRLIPLPGESVDIVTGQTTEVEVQLDPNRDITVDGNGGGYGQKGADDNTPNSCGPGGPCGKPFKLASNYGIKVIAASVTGVIPDRVVVRFKSGVSRATIDAINAAEGTTVINLDAPTNYFILHLPPGRTVTDAIRSYLGRGEVMFALPDNVIEPRAVPCNGSFQNPGPFTQVNATTAWNVTTGTTFPLLVDTDFGFDLSSPNMVLNYAINQGELLGVSFFDANNDGTVTAAEVVSFDADGDGLITFRDLNAPAFATFCGGASCDRDGDGLVTPLDLTSAGAGGGLFENGMDDDGNNFPDDLVGWDFGGNDNQPEAVGPASCLNTHGVGTGGIIAGIGQTMACNANAPVAGMDWVGRMVPVKLGSGSLGLAASTRAGSYLALRYAAGFGPVAINASWGVTYNKGGLTSGCNRGIANIGDKYGGLLNALQQEGSGLGLGNALLVVAAEDCAQNDDNANIFDWPVELASPNVFGVTSVTSAPAALAGGRAFGPVAIKIAAPGENHTTLSINSTVTTGCNGTSFSAPMVTGALGLMVAQNNALNGNPSTLLNRLLCNATQVAGMTAQVQNGQVLEVNRAVTNAAGCTP